MPTRWKIEVELTFDMKPGDTEEQYPGDTEEDFARRALNRVRERLNGILDSSAHGSHEGPGFAHYHITKMPEKCVDS